jgi:ribonucleoside-diphosphate reductase alpha chain
VPQNGHSNVDHPDIKIYSMESSRRTQVVALVTGSKIAYDHLKAIMESAEANGIDPMQNPELKKKISAAKSQSVPLTYIKRVLMLVENGVKASEFHFSTFDTDYRSEAYITVDGQNSNNSIRITDAFMQAVEADREWNLISRIDGSVKKTVQAKEIWDKIAEQHGNRQIQVCNSIPPLTIGTPAQRWSNNASNPCSEYMFLDETACNPRQLISRNSLRQKRVFDVHLRYVCDHCLGFLYLCRNHRQQKWRRTFQYRTLGLGLRQSGHDFDENGLPYDSAEARSVSGAITAIMTGIRMQFLQKWQKYLVRSSVTR